MTRSIENEKKSNLLTDDAKLALLITPKENDTNRRLVKSSRTTIQMFLFTFEIQKNLKRTKNKFTGHLGGLLFAFRVRTSRMGSLRIQKV